MHVGLALAKQPPLEPVELDGVASGAAWKVPQLRGVAAATEGLEDPHSPHPADRVRPGPGRPPIGCGPRPSQPSSRPAMPPAAPSQRLVGRVQRSQSVTVQIVDDTVLDTPAVIAFGRLVVLGGDAQRIHEEIVSAGGTVTRPLALRDPRPTRPGTPRRWRVVM